MKTDPWAPQQGYLKDAFAAAQSTYDKNMQAGPYGGDYVAAPSQQQYGAYGNAVTQGYNAQGFNNGMMSLGANNAAAGASGAGSAMGGLLAQGGDQTQNNIDKANAYAAGMDIPGAVQAAMRDANRNASENVLPGIDRAAAASGGINSDRAALAQGVVQRGLAEKAGDLSATMRNAAYTSGLQNAQQANSLQNGALSAAGGLGAGLLSAGNGAQDAGIDNQTGLNANITGGANGATELDQAKLNNLMAQYQGKTGFGWSQLNNMMGVVGSQNWGNTQQGTTTTQQNPSLLQNIGSGIGIASALFCDERIKHVYGPTGGNWRGFPEYLFSYIGLDGLHRGPLAQDVELTHPHAVTTIGGIKVILTDQL